MSEMRNFDEHLRKSFSGYSPDVPSRIWQNIAAERKKRRPAGWWVNKKILGAALLLGAVTGAIFLFNKTGDSDPKKAFNKNNITFATGSNKSIAPVAKENTTSTPSTVITVTDKQERNVQLIDHSEHNPQLPTINGRQLTAIGADHTNNNSGTYVRRNSSNTTSKYKRSSAHSAINPAEEATRQNAVEPGSAALAFDEPAQKISGHKDHSAVPAPDLLLTSLYFNAEKLTAASLADNRKPELKAVIIPGCSIPGCPPDKDAAGDKQYWEVYAGPDYAIKKYNDTANSVLLEKRKESTSFQYAFSAGVRYTRVFSNGVSLRAGLNYSQVNEKFSYIQSNVVQVFYEISPAGDTISSYNVRGTKYKTSYNHYRTIDVPVMVGYELGNGKLHANINAGAVINLYSWQKGETLDTALLPVSFNSGKNNPAYQYKTNVGIGFIGAVSVYYKLNDYLHLLAEPYYRYNFSPMNKEVLSIQERFYTIGLRLGLRVDL